MDRSDLPRYLHKRNPDGSFDSVCPQCFVTVGSSAVESELGRLEAAHVCFGFGLNRLLYPMEHERFTSDAVGATEQKHRRRLRRK